MPFIFVCVDRPNKDLMAFLKDLDRVFDAVITASDSRSEELGKLIVKNVPVSITLHTSDLLLGPQTEETRLRMDTFLESVKTMPFQTAIIVSYESNFTTWNKNSVAIDDWGIGGM